jgi:uncharacterized protein YndB with AHSA1/START domain
VHELIRRRVELDDPPGEVWGALITPERLAAWFGAVVDLHPRPGGAIEFAPLDGPPRRGVVEVVEPSRRLAFRWRTVRFDDGALAVGDVSRVEFELAPLPGGRTALTVTESSGLLAPDREMLVASRGATA